MSTLGVTAADRAREAERASCVAASGCCAPWREARRNAAIEALAALGIVEPPKDEAPR